MLAQKWEGRAKEDIKKTVSPYSNCLYKILPLFAPQWGKLKIYKVTYQCNNNIFKYNGSESTLFFNLFLICSSLSVILLTVYSVVFINANFSIMGLIEQI